MNIRDTAITIYSNGDWSQPAGPKTRTQEGAPQRTYEDFLTEERQKAAAQREELLQQIKDPESDLYSRLQQKILLDEQKRQEENREQATLDALNAIMDCLSAKGTDSGSEEKLTEAGAQLAHSADPEELSKGYLPLELQVYLAVLSGRAAFQTAEPEDSEAEKVRAAEEARSAEHPADKSGLTEEELGALAEEYDPRHMERAEFLEFMDRLADMGALSQQGAEAIQNAGKWIVTVRDESGNAVEPLQWKNGEPSFDHQVIPFLFGEHSMEGDVLSWAALASGNSDFRRLAEILERMETQRNQSSSEPVTAKIEL